MKIENYEKDLCSCKPYVVCGYVYILYLKELGCYVYVKINHRNKIEEIGIDIEVRMHNTRVEDMKKKEATRLQKSIFNRIGGEYWCHLYNQHQRRQYERPPGFYKPYD